MIYQRIVLLSAELSLSEWDHSTPTQIMTGNVQQFGVMNPVKLNDIKPKSI